MSHPASPFRAHAKPPEPTAVSAVPAHQAQALENALVEHGVHVPDTPAAQATALLPVLHHIQDALGHVPPALVPLLAQAFQRSRAEVHGVLTYYHHFRSQPPGPHVVQLCQAEACRAMGAVFLMREAQAMLQGQPGDSKGALTLEPVYCLGLCAQAPAGQINGEPQAPLSLAALRAWGQAQGLLNPAASGGVQATLSPGEHP